ncbi:hypothetical protein F5Y05DRAFT_411596 [Hypoxylon sp. FL0543]|nr:hypothetical protein F5Y05DRAFT_411596 [Hypoxylon sp. FL0543]
MVSLAVFCLTVALAAIGNVTFARRSVRVSMPPFPNLTHVLNANAECYPFEDPHCCVDRVVCECFNGTFFSVNPSSLNGTNVLCLPPGNITYGQDTSSIPGWCC